MGFVELSLLQKVLTEALEPVSSPGDRVVIEGASVFSPALEFGSDLGDGSEVDATCSASVVQHSVIVGRTAQIKPVQVLQSDADDEVVEVFLPFNPAEQTKRAPSPE